jgi:uncharacterized protein (DUF697 family)
VKNEAHQQMLEQARACIETHANQAIAVSFIPLISTPIVYGVCTKMIVQLDKIFGIPTKKGWDSEIVNNILAGVIAAPALMIPILGAGVASVYIKSIGENYAKAVSTVLSHATDEERHDSEYITRSIKEELQKIYAQRHTQKRRKIRRHYD